jgi:AbiJ N-terminal domain 4
MKFSERVGAVRRVLQKGSVDEPLKNSLWNVIHKQFLAHFPREYSENERASAVPEGALLLSLWTDHFTRLADDALSGLAKLKKQVRDSYIASNWSEVYDFVEFVVGYPRPKKDTDQLVVPITSEEEIAAVELAMSYSDEFGPVVSHLETALARLADRAAPDYRNSIKESISAVEAVCQIITGGDKATLGQALKRIGIHPALEKGFAAIYGYTSDADGIRHALLEESTLEADDAKFFLVSCSAFTNYLIAKSV